MRALIPCGGRGTRMAALAGGGPKEMLPVAGAPAIDWVLRECAASGIDDVLIVSAPGKDPLVTHLRALTGAPAMPRSITCVIQPAARGLADAIRLGRDFAAGDSLAVALPDNIFVADPPAMRQVIESHHRTARSVVAVVEIAAADAARRGPTAALDGVVHGAEYRITRIPDKGAKDRTFDVGGAASAYTAVGRYVFLPDALREIDAVERTLPPGAELDDVPLMQRLLARDALVGRIIVGRFLDVGLPSGYADANDVL